ncbi:hypothetical protein [Gynuella sunshinyii]|uniref:Uncharacterized protein n=1 Tax=Gynuella sunshinyii YC6258 TaxID=1445510 RepID=A0A0C5VIJ8_9GAMM|nr:hypothetical protein [Gynuella sunshinyii]AJQ94091.1 hypothetical Protein YC6258_02047 [Gynuella sunshinyii YC6258]
MNLKTLISIGLCIATLTACKPDLRTIGTVDDDKLITPAMIDEMGFEEFEKRYLGKEVTVADFYSAKSTGGYQPQDGQCILAAHSGDKHINRDITVYIC